MMHSLRRCGSGQLTLTALGWRSASLIAQGLLSKQQWAEMHYGKQNPH
jgi:hypothetical protein